MPQDKTIPANSQNDQWIVFTKASPLSPKNHIWSIRMECKSSFMAVYDFTEKPLAQHLKFSKYLSSVLLRESVLQNGSHLTRITA